MCAASSPGNVFLTFSLLNSVSPGAGQPVLFEPTFAFSLLNSVGPGVGQPVLFEPTFSFSVLNSVSPGTGQPILYEPTFAFSLLNSVNPGAGQSFLQQPSILFSLLNQAKQSAATNTAVPNLLPNAALTNATGKDLLIKVAAMTPSERALLLSQFTGPDTDGDGLPDALEIALGTDPFNPDTDGDGFPDGLEFLLGSDPLDPASVPTPLQLVSPPVIVGGPLSIQNVPGILNK